MGPLDYCFTFDVSPIVKVRGAQTAKEFLNQSHFTPRQGTRERQIYEKISICMKNIPFSVLTILEPFGFLSVLSGLQDPFLLLPSIAFLLWSLLKWPRMRVPPICKVPVPSNSPCQLRWLLWAASGVLSDDLLLGCSPPPRKTASPGLQWTHCSRLLFHLKEKSPRLISLDCSPLLAFC